ncbi:MAG: hypothetical protein JXB05_34285 [Myxococcaceae bacterium]|nr:hypothetical protein [Myxococcaceae bacterium]
MASSEEGLAPRVIGLEPEEARRHPARARGDQALVDECLAHGRSLQQLQHEGDRPSAAMLIPEAGRDVVDRRHHETAAEHSHLQLELERRSTRLPLQEGTDELVRGCFIHGSRLMPLTSTVFFSAWIKSEIERTLK